MTTIQDLDGSIPRQDRLTQRSREYRIIFDAAVAFWMKYHSPDFDPAQQQPDPLFLKILLEKMTEYEAKAIGYAALARLAPDVGAGQVADYRKKALTAQLLAFVHAYAVRRTNRYPDGSLYLEAPAFDAQCALERIQAAPVDSDKLSALANSLNAVEARGWSGSQRKRPPITVIGANWCSDTAVTIVEVCNALQVPVNVIFMEYFKPEEDKGKRMRGILMMHDHAQAVYEDGYGKPSIPIIRHASGAELIEPTLPQFVGFLADHSVI